MVSVGVGPGVGLGLGPTGFVGLTAFRPQTKLLYGETHS